MATVVQWTVEDVASWLEQCLLLPYGEEFLQAGIDGVQLVHLTRQGLLGLGVDKEEHIKCLLDHVSVLRIQWERSLRAACQGQPTDMPSGFDASWRSESADGQCTRTKHRARMVWPRVGSPILHATFRGSRQNDEECQKELHDAACKVREPCRQPEVGKDEAQDCQQGAKTESKDSKE
ncbi:SAM domain-containing protein, partial [Durusdinium trenchii]